MSRRIAAIGECMIELSGAGDGVWRQGFAGDTANTATYMARLLAASGNRVDYVTAIGDDPFSSTMLEGWRREAIGTEFVTILAGRLPGLYAIRTDASGERQFFYWREQAAARSLMDDEGNVQAAIALSDMVFLSGITLAILDKQSRRKLIDRLRDAKSVAFDPNYRPKLWPEVEEAKRTFAEVMAISDIALPTFDDEALLFGDASAEATMQRIAGYGAKEIVVKRGHLPCLVRHGTKDCQVPAERVENVVDTTGAGDSFNAAYLAARVLGLPTDQAASAGHKLAAFVVQHRGAIMPVTAMPDLGLTT